jgi:nucleotide-binding universal stress UspA family protein
MIDRILIPLDGSDLAEQALPHGVLQARRFGAHIFLLRVVEPIPPAAAEWAVPPDLEAIQEGAASYLAGIVKPLVKQGLRVDYCVRMGPPAETILAFARAEGVNLIAMSTHGRSGIGRWVYGSVADKVLRGAGTPVFLIRASESTPPVEVPGYRRLLVPLDGSELAELALPYAETWARTFHSEVILLRVPTLPAYVSLGPDASMLVPSLLSEAYDDADTYLANMVRKLKAKGLAVHKAAVEPGAIADTIVDYAHDAGVDCIVMSTHGRSGLGRWVYGSVADRVLRGSGVPVLLVRAPKGTSNQ